MNLKDLHKKDLDLATRLEKHIRELESDIAERQKSIEKYRTILSCLNTQSIIQQKKRYARPGKPVIGLELKDKISKVLQEAGGPLTAGEIRERINERFPEKQYHSLDNFSGHLGMTLKRNTEMFRKLYIPSNPIPYRTYTGLAEWFNGETLKDEYKTTVYDYDKILAAV